MKLDHEENPALGYRCLLYTSLGFITREGSSNSHTAILARSMNIPALIQCKDIQDDWDGKMAVIDGYNACVYVDPTPDLLKSLKKRQQEDQQLSLIHI